MREIVPLYHPFCTTLFMAMNPRRCETCGAWGHRAKLCPLKRLNEMQETLGPRKPAQPGRERDLPDLRRPGRRVEQSFCVPRLIWCREERKPMARMPASFCPDFGIHTLPSIKKAMNLHPICPAVIGSSGNVLRTRRLLIYVYRL